jgi:hypothetical protein
MILRIRRVGTLQALTVLSEGTNGDHERTLVSLWLVQDSKRLPHEYEHNINAL